MEEAKIVDVPREPSFGPGAGCMVDREVIRGVVDSVQTEKGFAFVVTHKGRVFMGLNAQLVVKKGSIVEITVVKAEKV